jgi:hypothetical protein
MVPPADPVGIRHGSLDQSIKKPNIFQYIQITNADACESRDSVAGTENPFGLDFEGLRLEDSGA